MGTFICIARVYPVGEVTVSPSLTERVLEQMKSQQLNKNTT